MIIIVAVIFFGCGGLFLYLSFAGNSDRATSLKDKVSSSSVPRRLHIANCSHCGHKYGQIAFSRYMLIVALFDILIFTLAIILKFVPLIFVPLFSIFLFHRAPYYKLEENGGASEVNEDLIYEFELLEKHGEIKPDEIYFLDKEFDAFEPFFPASPIQVYYVPRKGNTVKGEFLYNNEKTMTLWKKTSAICIIPI